MAKAEPGQVLTTAQTCSSGAAARFETSELEPFRLKGIAEPVTATRPCRSGHRRDRHRPARPFVGRERELMIISAALGAGADGLRQLGRADRRARARQVPPRRGALRTGPDLSGSPPSASSTRPRPRTSPSAGSCARCSTSRPTRPAARRCAPRSVRLDPACCRGFRSSPSPLDVAVEPTQEAEELQPAFRRARLHGVIETLLAELLDADATARRGRALDGRGVVRAPAPPGHADREQALADLRDPPPGRRRLRGGRRRAAHPGDDDPAAAAAGGVARADRRLRGRGPAPARGLRDRRARRREPALPAGARYARSRAPERRRCPRASRRSSRPESTGCAPGDRALLRYAAVLGATFTPSWSRRARGRSRRVGRLGGLGPAGRSSSSATRTRPAPSASATRSSATRPTRASPSGGGASCTERSARRIERLEQQRPRRVRRAPLAPLLPCRRRPRRLTASR